ncbi:MAG: hypothetical protein HRU38_00280 [Saccharospirillaceae bacterium]|nr:hypothetical protein [Saccharospirillaceae bacterium]
MKKIVTLLSLLAILIISALIYVYLWLVSPPPASVNEAENAIATQNVILLAHVNNQRINSIMNYTGIDPKSLDLPALNNNILSELYFGINQLNENAEQVVFSVNGGESISYNALINGHFNWKTLQLKLNKHFHIKALEGTTITGKNFHLLRRYIDDGSFVCPDEKAKIEKQEFYLTVTNEWLILSSEQAQLSIINERLLSKKTAEVDLTNWRTFRDNHLASISLLVPEHSAKMATGITAFIIKEVVSENQEFKSVYFGGDINLLKRNLRLNSQINANVSWVENALIATQEYLQTLQKNIDSTSPTLAKLLGNFSIEKQQSSLITQLMLNEQDIGELPNVFKEVMSSVFSSMFGLNKNEKAQEEESIMESTWDYSKNEKWMNLQDFKITDTSDISRIVNGPLALHMESVKLNKELNLIEIRVHSSINEPKTDGSWSDSKANFTLSIDSVNNAAGENLLRDERCVKDFSFGTANHQPATGYDSSFDIGYTDKRVRLTPNSTFKDVANISGEMAFSIPTAVEYIDLDLAKEASYEKHGVRFYINDFAQQSVTYQVSGKTDNILEIRGLNAKGQILNTNFTRGSGDKKTLYLKGDVAKIQLVVATQHSGHKASFNLSADKFFPEGEFNGYYLSQRPSTVSKKRWNDTHANTKDKGQKLTQSNVIKYLTNNKYSREDIVATFYQSPFGFSLSHYNKSSWVQPAKFELAIPFIPELAFNLQAIQVSVQHKEISALKYVEISPSFYIIDDKRRSKHQHDELVDGIGFMKISTYLDLGVPAKESMKTLNGQVLVQLPKKISTVNIGNPSFAETTFDHGIKVKLTAISGGFMPNYHYEVSAKNLINMIAVLDNGREVLPARYQATLKNDDENGYMELRFPALPNIDHFEVMVATQVEKIAYPFTLTPEYK